ncbi:MAG TPA: hypothetical protein VMB50_14275, partial [Myxococcales bacterium]|nr:hypothetical protein [Myxococcales bacterium]
MRHFLVSCLSLGPLAFGLGFLLYCAQRKKPFVYGIRRALGIVVLVLLPPYAEVAVSEWTSTGAAATWRASPGVPGLARDFIVAFWAVCALVVVVQAAIGWRWAHGYVV